MTAYSEDVKAVFTRAILSVLDASYLTKVRAMPIVETDNDTAALGEIATMQPFSGEGVAGILSVAASQQHLLAISDRLHPRPKKTDLEVAKALACDITHRLLSTLEVEFLSRGVALRKGFAVAADHINTSMTFRAGSSVLRQTCNDNGHDIIVEMRLDHFTPSGHKPVDVMQPGTAVFFNKKKS